MFLSAAFHADTLPRMTTEPTRGFKAADIHARWAALQHAMQTAGMDALMLTTEPDVRYVSGYLTPFWQSPTRTWTVILPASGEPIAVIATIGEPLMRTTPIKHIVTYSSPHPADDARRTLQSVLQQLRSESEHKKRFQIGVPMGAETTLRMPLADWHALQSTGDEMDFVDATHVVQSVQQIKSTQEVDIIRFVAQCASNVYAQLPDALSPGMNEIQVFKTFKQLALIAGVDDVAFLVGGADADGYRDIIGPPSTRKLTAGDVLILDTGCTRDGYYCDFDRNYSVGKASTRVAQAHHVTWDATEAGLQTVKPGVTCQDVFHAMQAVMQPYTSDSASGDVGRLGHGLGMQLTETPSFTAYDNTVLKPGMVLTLEPGYCYGDGQVMVHEENLVVTDTGYELLTTRAPRDIMSIPA